MNWLLTILILSTAFLTVFWQSAFTGLRDLLGAQIDLLPPLIVYTSLHAGFGTLLMVTLFGSLWLDSLSANPLGISLLPLLVTGLAMFSKRDLILREQFFAQCVLGALAGALVPIFTLLLLLTLGDRPLLGWGTLWQLIVLTTGGAIGVPIFSTLFEWLHRQLEHGRPAESSFRPDREIRRGR